MRVSPHRSQSLLRGLLASMGACAIQCSRVSLAVALLILPQRGATAQAGPKEPIFTLPTGEFDPWLPHGPERAWNGLTSSADGRLLAATAREDRIHTSSDYGETWIARGTVQAWQAIASSADGQRLVAVVEGGRIHTSDDAGATWIERESARKWSSVASSTNGLRLAATVSGGRIHTSTNGGISWSKAGPTQAWSAITSSADGLRLAATVFDGPIHVSVDGGKTWEASGPIKLWKAIASSADGTRLAAAVWDGRINTSTNSALNWTEWDSNPYGLGGRIHLWTGIACPADGRSFVAVEVPSQKNWAGEGMISVSDEFGASWEEQAWKSKWTAIACSANGDRWVAAGERGRIHTQFRTTSRHTVYASIDSGPTVVRQFATAPSQTPAGQATNRWVFETKTDKPELFQSPPVLLPDGTLSFATANRQGRALVTVSARSEDGTLAGGAASSAPQTFCIQVQSRAFVASPWRNDADTGISLSSTLWAYRFAPTNYPPAIVNGLMVPPVAGIAPTIPGRFALVGPDHERTRVSFLSTQGGEGSGRIADYGIYGPPKLTLTLEGLVPGVPYTLHILALAGERTVPVPVTWFSETERVIIDEHQFGMGKGIRVSHSFVPSAATYQLGYTPLMADGWWLAGLALNSTPPQMALESPNKGPAGRDSHHEFGARPLGTDANLAFSVRNTGMVPLSAFVFSKSGPNPDDFDVVVRSTDPIPGRGGSASLVVEFSPTALGPRNATLKISSSDPEPFVLNLSGTGLPEDAILIRDIPDQVIDEDSSTLPLSLDLGTTTSGRPIQVSAKSGDPVLVPNSNIVIQGIGSQRRVVVTPAPDRFGSTVIRIRTSDGVRTACHLFRLTVNPVNDPPRFRIPPGKPIPVGNEWIARAPHFDWRAIALSHDGRTQVAVPRGGPIHTSTDSGVSWQARGEERAWSSVASSTHGSRLVAAVGGGFLYTSTNGGRSWFPRGESRNWVAVASSADGTRLAAAEDGGQLHVSADGGLSWVARERNRSWKSIASSADGLTLLAAAQNGLLHLSINGGQTWTARGEAQSWIGVASSADGSHLAAAVNDGRIYVSTDAGSTWLPRGDARFWQAISMSSDGRFLAAAETLGHVFVSSDFGLTWTEGGGVDDGGGLAISGDGSTLAAPVRHGAITISAARVEPHTLTVDGKSGSNTLREFVTGLIPGPENESEQAVSLIATNSHPALFARQPTVDASGTLTFTPAGQAGSALVTLVAADSGGTAHGGRDTTEPRTFQIEVRGEGFSYGPWLDDSSSGISQSATLWACRFGLASTDQLSIQGFPVPLLSDIRPMIPGHFALTGVGKNQTDANRISVVRGGNSLGGGFLYGGHPAIIILDGLIPGTHYVLLSFGVGFGNPGETSAKPRACRWTSESNTAVIDEQVFGASSGIRVAYSFTATRSRRVISVTPIDGETSWHFYGMALNAAPAALVIEGPEGSPLKPFDTLKAGAQTVGDRSNELTLTLKNSGVIPLRALRATVMGGHADEFRITMPLPGDVPQKLLVRFVPAGLGTRTATLSIASNDPQSNPFVLQLAGTGLSQQASTPGDQARP